MIPRYSRPEMSRIWADENRFSTWLKIELAATDALCRRGIVPREAREDIDDWLHDRRPGHRRVGHVVDLGDLPAPRDRAHGPQVRGPHASSPTGFRRVRALSAIEFGSRSLGQPGGESIAAAVSPRRDSGPRPGPAASISTAPDDATVDPGMV